jgi:hypothetical protein
MHQHDPCIYRLPIHLPDQHIVIYEDVSNLAHIARNRQRSRTMLTEFFTYCENHPEEARDLLYPNALDVLTWLKETNRKACQPRAGGTRRVIGRIYWILPRDGELYYLRTLLHCVTSPKSFENLRTYQQMVYGTFRDACRARGLLEDDRE